MDKKTIIPRKQSILKGKGNFAPGTGFIALGARSTTPDASSSGLKREGGAHSSSILHPLKRPRFGAGPGDIVKPGLPHHLIKKEIEAWHSLAVDVPLLEILERIDDAESKNNTKHIEEIMCGVISHLNENRAKIPDPLLTSIICYLAREKPTHFQFDSVVEGFFSLLKKTQPVKGQNLRTHPYLCSLISNVLICVFEGKEFYPDYFVKAYLDDALTERVWVDKNECSKLVNAIELAFNTKKPSQQALASIFVTEAPKPVVPLESLAAHNVAQVGGQSPFDDRESGGSSSRDATLVEDQTGSGGLTISIGGDLPVTAVAPPNEAIGTTSQISTSDNNAGIELTGTGASSSTPVLKCKFDTDSVKEFTVEILRDLWSKRPDTISKSLLKTMASCCGYPEVCLAASQKLDNWIQNPKLQRSCVDLMLYMCMNCKNLASPSEQEIVQNFLKLRLLKSKPVTNSFCIALKELLNQNDQCLKFVLRSVVCNEFSPSSTNVRSPNNMLIFSQCFQFKQLLATKHLAEIFFEFLLDKDEHLRNLRLLLREIVKTALKYDFPFVAFCEALCNQNDSQKIHELNPAAKEKLYHCIEDLLTLSILLGISPMVKDVSISLSRSERRDLFVLRNYHQQLVQVQLRIIDWLQHVVPIVFRPTKEDYVKTFARILFLEKPDYYNKDNMPELEKTLFLKIISEASLSEEILIKICIIGLSPNLLLNSSQAIDLIDQLIKKTASAASDGKTFNENAIIITKLELIELLWSSCAYRISDLSVFPPGYHPPTFAITFSYWRVVVILLILSCYNPSNTGRLIWENYPTLRIVMQMIMAEDYNFPPATASAIGLTSDEIRRKDMQTAEVERHDILELENYLAAASTKVTITESNSHLLSQIMRLDPKGPIRRPPHFVLEQLKSLNQQLHLGLFLCKSRDPDFLLEIVNKQGASHSLPWLVHLIQKNEGSLSVLPIQCLCEFLLYYLENLHNSEDDDNFFENNEDMALLSNLLTDHRVGELRYRLRNAIWSSSGDVDQFVETLTYFVNRLQADTRKARLIATKALNLLTFKAEDKQDSPDLRKNDAYWLKNVTLLPHFSTVKNSIASTLLKCCLIETDPSTVRFYVQFFNDQFQFSSIDDDSTSTIKQILNESIHVFSKLICQRRTFFEQLVQPDWSTKRTNQQTATLSFLLQLFNYYLQRTRKPQDQASFSWSANQEQLLIQWGDLSAVLNVETVSASLLLLAVDKPKDCEIFDELLNVWFPRQPPKPCAFLVDTTEEAELIPDWLKICLLRSRCDHVVDSVLNMIDDGQIIVCLQTFGLPVNNVSKLLRILDEITDDQQNRRQSVLLQIGEERLKTLSGFVHSYQLLGAKHGGKFLEFISDMGKNLKPAADTDKSESDRKSITKMEIDEILPISDSFADIDLNNMNDLIAKLLFTENMQQVSDPKNSFSNFILRIINEPVTLIPRILDVLLKIFNKNPTEFCHFLNKNCQNFAILFRIFDRFIPTDNIRKRFIDFSNRLLDDESSSRGELKLRIQLLKISGKSTHLEKDRGKMAATVDGEKDVSKPKSVDLSITKKSESPNIDITVHRLLNDLLKLASNLYSDSKMENVNCLLRRLATEHPILFLRQLHLIAALLRGNMSHTMKIYYNTNYLLLFAMILGLLELLKPHLFDKSNLESLEDIINSFFEFIENHALRNPRLVGIIDKVTMVLNDYHTADPERANKYLESCNALIQALTIRYPEVVSLKTLMSRCNYVIPLILNSSGSAPNATASAAGTGGTGGSAETESTVEQLKPLPHRPPSPVQPNQISLIMNRLSRTDSTEDTMQILNDLSELSTKKPDALPYFRVHLEQLVTHSSKECCRLAFELLLKHFSNKPAEASTFLPILLSCFDIGREEITKIAMSFVPSFCRLYSKNVGVLLETAYGWCVKNASRENIQLLCEAVNSVHHNTLDSDK